MFRQRHARGCATFLLSSWARWPNETCNAAPRSRSVLPVAAEMLEIFEAHIERRRPLRIELVVEIFRFLEAAEFGDRSLRGCFGAPR